MSNCYQRRSIWKKEKVAWCLVFGDLRPQETFFLLLCALFQQNTDRGWVVSMSSPSFVVVENNQFRKERWDWSLSQYDTLQSYIYRKYSAAKKTEKDEVSQSEDFLGRPDEGWHYSLTHPPHQHHQNQQGVVIKPLLLKPIMNSNVVVSEQILISHISLLIERNIHEYLQILTPFLNIPVLYISHTDPLIGRTNGAWKASL